jgi:hypothetical protein
MDKKLRGKDKIKSWEKMVTKLRGKFVNYSYHLKMKRILETLKKKNKCVE